MPGLGGVFENQNFQLNCAAWQELRKSAEEKTCLQDLLNIKVSPSQLRCGPVTGAVENVGYEHEEDFYFPYLNAANQAGYGLCVGDGFPDEKLHFGLEAVKKIGKKAAFFLKPYPDSKLYERIELVKDYAQYIGIDIDSYNIVTMRNLVNLEKKSALQLENFRNHSQLPFVIKGVFTQEDINLVKEVKPDVVYISNHGGRVETRIGSSGEFLFKYAGELKNYCKEIWVDGGIRSKLDVQTALFYGADKVIMARPLIRAVYDGEFEVFKEFHD
ncbi:MAG: alpha-hydroxy-acid oxidizing protein [Treponema sp.]|nr:alpha-hydroxy-acid oxidizing protein [Treponema sp.]